jgi:hypothetical protein
MYYILACSNLKAALLRNLLTENKKIFGAFVIFPLYFILSLLFYYTLLFFIVFVTFTFHSFML